MQVSTRSKAGIETKVDSGGGCTDMRWSRLGWFEHRERAGGLARHSTRGNPRPTSVGMKACMQRDTVG
eukprot:366465-Chlamydomonas_euryale.AAC.6